ncbi:MAG TPA: hypothetical protein VFQ80_10405 [Thermomicrobiales bacterium]|nr:hypothetical protein [Thermomicrobiales bacterium]
MEQQADAGPALADTVLGVIERDRLSGALAALHRAGFGPHTRVLDGKRGDLAGQIRRSALHDAIDASRLASNLAVVVVSAPGRAALVADTLLRHGARNVQALNRRPPARPVARPGDAPDIAPQLVAPRDEARS